MRLDKTLEERAYSVASHAMTFLAGANSAAAGMRYCESRIEEGHYHALGAILFTIGAVYCRQAYKKLRGLR